MEHVRARRALWGKTRKARRSLAPTRLSVQKSMKNRKRLPFVVSRKVVSGLRVSGVHGVARTTLRGDVAFVEVSEDRLSHGHAVAVVAVESEFFEVCLAHGSLGHVGVELRLGGGDHVQVEEHLALAAVPGFGDEKARVVVDGDDEGLLAGLALAVLDVECGEVDAALQLDHFVVVFRHNIL